MTDEARALATLRAAALRGALDEARTVATTALAQWPRALEIRRALAGIERQRGDDAAALHLLRAVMEQAPGDFAAAATYAELQIEVGRMRAAGAALKRCFEATRVDPEQAIRAIEMLADAQRQHDALAIADAALAIHPRDARLHAYAGMLRVQTGDFEQARADYLRAIELDPRALDWHALQGLASAQRYTDADHPDFELLRRCVARADLARATRRSALFALGKACDDIGDYDQATRHLRQANALAHEDTRWSRKAWKRALASRLSARRMTHALAAREWTPLFIVGMPRSGTTLLAERLGRLDGVRNRGELPWLARLAASPALAGDPTAEALARAAHAYERQVLQDDDAPVRCYIDKQPLNFRYLDLALAMFPHAKVLWCRRGPRDNALSLWSQDFVEDVQGYAADFGDIAQVMADAERMLRHWRLLFPDSIRTVHYEDFVVAPGQCVAQLAQWLGIAPGAAKTHGAVHGAIGTASLWQARQPVYTRSIERWRNYAPFVPELLRFSAELQELS